MCLIIAKPFNARVDLEHVEIASFTNADGIGISISNGKDIQIHKYMSFKAFKQAHEADLQNESLQCLIHLRYGTHGSKTLKNVHPFRTSHGYAFAHNGVLDIKVKRDITDSETYMRRHFNGVSNPADPVFVESISKDIGSSKFVLMMPDKFVFFNEQLGHWNKENGCWYSNYGYCNVQDLGWGATSNRFTRTPYGYTDTRYSVPFYTVNELLDIIDDNLPDLFPKEKLEIMEKIEQYIDACELVQYGDDDLYNLVPDDVIQANDGDIVSIKAS